MHASRNMKILIVENSDPIRRDFSSCLRHNGYEVFEAIDSDTAMEMLVDRKPDLIITDLCQPGVDGMAILEKASRETPMTPVIIVSEAGTMEQIVRALKKGAFDFITKPVDDPAILKYAVDKGMERVLLIEQNREHQEHLEELVKKRTLELEKRTHELELEIKKRRTVEMLIEHAKKEWERTIDAIPDLIALVDRDHRIMRLNKPMAMILGIPVEKAVGEKCYEHLHGADAPPDTCPHTQLLQDGKSHTIEVYEERLGGYNEIMVTPYHDPDGILIGSVHIIRNINERKHAEEEREKLHAQLLHAQKLESVGQLAAGIAHEINTPTQYVGTNIDFLEEGFQDLADLITKYNELLEAVKANQVFPELIEEIEKAIEDADWEYLMEEIPQAISQSRDGIRRVTSIVRAMKDFSHPGGREKEPSDINQIIETTVTIARNEWKYVSDMELELADGLPMVPCLKDEMGQVILNLIVNAAQAIGSKLGENPEGKKGVITIGTSWNGESVGIRVSDTGTGIPEHARSKVFQPFFTTKDVGKGTGQGLAIAHNVIVDKHGGSIEFETEDGKGTTFIIRLPVDKSK